MSEHAFDDKEMTGYYLPEDSQRLLTQIRHHIHFLARLATSRSADETQEAAPAMDMAELKFCLEQLAGLLDLVLQAVPKLKRAQPLQASSDKLEADGEDNDETISDDIDEKDDAPVHTYAMQADAEHLVLGVTLDQFDKLKLLVASIKAFGDAVYADATAEFAKGTLSMLGYTIFDRAEEVDDILSEIDAQTLPQRPVRHSVKEEPATYGAQPWFASVRLGNTDPMAWPIAQTRSAMSPLH
ncbi:XAC0095 family protein [Pseudoxanthomonas composti]|uniref:XAC0095-like domain-containing protein n=1 Tax=Pseudoxanthomonas composti TaxID=2137479 RepID=A0A4V1N173_9GAMM|nr:hypothetical protein [Pseudoxanthomonas composti]RXR06356.1 hypothetical protein EPA99_06795 [Pseudoxanthomonas composti]